MFLPVISEIDQAFREDGNLPRKLLASVALGLTLAWFAYEFGLPDTRGPVPAVVYACLTVITVAVCVGTVTALSLKDVVRRRIREGQTVSIVLRLYLVSGLLSLMLWVITTVFVTYLAATYWPW